MASPAQPSMTGHHHHGGQVVENPSTGCYGISFPSLTPGHEPVITGPTHNTASCGCLSEKLFSKEDMRSHIDNLLRRGTISPEDVGVLTLRLRLRLPVSRQLQIDGAEDAAITTATGDLVDEEDGREGSVTPTPTNPHGRSENHSIGGKAKTTTPEMPLPLLEKKLRRADTLESFPPLDEGEVDNEGKSPETEPLPVKQRKRSNTIVGAGEEEKKKENKSPNEEETGRVRSQRAASGGWSALKIFGRSTQ